MCENCVKADLSHIHLKSRNILIIKAKKWSGRRGSNPRLSAPKKYGRKSCFAFFCLFLRNLLEFSGGAWHIIAPFGKKKMRFENFLCENCVKIKKQGSKWKKSN